MLYDVYILTKDWWIILFVLEREGTGSGAAPRGGGLLLPPVLEARLRRLPHGHRQRGLKVTEGVF